MCRAVPKIRLYPVTGKTAGSIRRSTCVIVAVDGSESWASRPCTICCVIIMSVLQSKNRLISAEPRAVVDLIRWMPGMPFIAS